MVGVIQRAVLSGRGVTVENWARGSQSLSREMAVGCYERFGTGCEGAVGWKVDVSRAERAGGALARQCD